MNPFGDSSDDESEGFNPFTTKKSIQTPASPNPFDNDDNDSNGRGNSVTKATASISNPFDNKHMERTDAPVASDPQPKSRLGKMNKKASSNPFDNDFESSTTSRPSSAKSNGSTSKSKKLRAKLLGGKGKESKSPPAVVKEETTLPASSPNPFDDDHDIGMSPSPNPFDDSPPKTELSPKSKESSNHGGKHNINSNPFDMDDPTPSSNHKKNSSTTAVPDQPIIGASARMKSKKPTPRVAATSPTKVVPIDPFESNPPSSKKKANPSTGAAKNGTSTSATNSNPFDFDANFESTPNKKEKVGMFGKSKPVDSGSVPLAAKVDLDTSVVVGSNTNGISAHEKAVEPSSTTVAPHAMLTSAQRSSSTRGLTTTTTTTTTTNRPGFLSNRAKSDATGIIGNNASGTRGKPSSNSAESTALKGWLNRNKAIDEGKIQQQQPKPIARSATTSASTNRAGHARMNKKKKKKRLVVKCWPYDDYHKEQEQYYQSIPESAPSTRRRHKDDEKKQNEANKAKDRLYERPSELPSIQEAVQNLSLLDFENKAEERAISIVSTWLFDAGLIDELLVQGGRPASSARFLSRMGTRGRAGISLSDQSLGSARSSEGVEVGVQGFPLEGSMKIEKEIEKLRSSAHRELTLINTRLNDGVSASGAEVQELVNAVNATKSELGRLRELTTYISGGYKKDYSDQSIGGSDGFLLSEFPRLKRIMNARKNIFRCFRELEFFAQIPMTCDRLREELHEGEWTENEWNTIRNVCMEHVELEILLVEAEAGMKAWLDDDDDEGDDDATLQSLRSNRSLKRSYKGKNSSISRSNAAGVDEFLSQHVKNVWELGEEIRTRILSGIGSAFSLALENPAGMVALVEAVEVYERAAEEYKASRHDDESNVGGERNRLQFTNMRADAIEQLFKDFELRGLEVFRAIHVQAADMADENDALTSQFNAVLRAATELVTEIDVVKNQMAPCFAPHWHVEMLWSSCVAHVCSNNIIQQIGGPEAQNLPDLTVTQLLDLVAWVEFFRETIEESFPSIIAMHSKKTHLSDILQGDKNEVNLENATDSLAWVNNMLWEVHRLAQDEFLLRTRSQIEGWLENVYNAEHETRQSSEGRLITSLCEDVFSLATVQLRTIRERLTKKSEALVMAVCSMFSLLRVKQISSRDKYLKDFEMCCAAANDFQRMGENCEDVLQDLIGHCSFPDESIEMLEESCKELVSVYSADAVYSAQKAQSFIFEPIWNAISDDLFGPKWETDLTHNELALTLTRTLEDFIDDLYDFLDEFMLKKTVDALVAGSVIFYSTCLLLCAEKHNNNKIGFFQDNQVALERMDRDVKVIKEFFDRLAQGMPALGKVIEKEFEILTTIMELLRIAAGFSESDASDFIVVLHKRVKDINITKHVVGDLWHLVKPTEEKAAWELTETLEESLVLITPPETAILQKRMNLPELRLDQSLAQLYIKSTRHRTGNAFEKMAANLRQRWANEETKE